MNLISLLERMLNVSAVNTQFIVDFLLMEFPLVEEMINKRRADFSKTGIIQIRVKPRSKDSDLSELLSGLESTLNSTKAKKAGMFNVRINKTSVHSGKYSSVSFGYLNDEYDIVVAKGANAGESFEKELLLKLDNYVKGIEDSKEAITALSALQKADPEINHKSIIDIVARSGSTKRSLDMSPSDMGKVIADIIIKTKYGDKYISVKNSAGKTLAQFGVSKFINNDLSINTDSEEWFKWFKPFNLDPNKISNGLIAARDGLEIDFDDTELRSDKIKKYGHVHKILALMWGSDYIYLREKGDKFLCMKIDNDYVSDVLLKNLKVTKVSYPCQLRKQITVYLESDYMDYKIEYRNPNGKGSFKPSQIQLSITKNRLEF